MQKETWEITGAQTLVQTIHDPASQYRLTREFNFSDRDISTSVEHGSDAVQSTYEVFHQVDQQLVKEAAAQMQRLGRAVNAARLLAQKRKSLAGVVGNASGIARDIAAPAIAKFKKKRPSAG